MIKMIIVMMVVMIVVMKVLVMVVRSNSNTNSTNLGSSEISRIWFSPFYESFSDDSLGFRS